MPDYQKMYYGLFNAITGALELLQTARQNNAVTGAIRILQQAQQDTEETYMSAEE